jgi:hypothetical protein
MWFLVFEFLKRKDKSLNLGSLMKENQKSKYWSGYHFKWYLKVFDGWCLIDMWHSLGYPPTLVLTIQPQHHMVKNNDIQIDLNIRLIKNMYLKIQI